jgi:hypothetical protein
MRELSEAERVLDAFAISVRSVVGGEAEISRLLEEIQGVSYVDEVAVLLHIIDERPSAPLLEAVMGARSVLERRYAPGWWPE